MSTPTARRMPAAAGPRAPARSLPPAPAWTALAHPASWSLCRDNDDVWHMLPSLIQITHMAGVGGVTVSVDSEGRRVADASQTVGEMTQRGYVAIPPVAVHAHGQVMPDYCVGHRAARGIVHTWAWVLPQVAQGRAVRAVDRDAEVAFRRWVMTELLGVDGAPDDILEANRIKMRDRALRLCVEVRSRPAAARGLEILAAQLRSLGWDEGLPLPDAYRAPQPAAPQRTPVAPDTSLDDLRAQIAALQAQLAAQGQTQAQAQTPTPTAAPSSSSAQVGSAQPGEAALPVLDDAPEDAQPRAPTRLPRRPPGG
jgi:hypothetical protein